MILSILSLFVSSSQAESDLNAVTNPARTVVILKFATHPALDEFEAGVIDHIERARKSSPALKGLTIERTNANGNPQLAKQLAERASRPRVALIVAIATPAAQAVARTPSTIPLLYGAVADPQGAGILDAGRATGIRNVGKNIIETALRFMRVTFPNAQRLGTLYNPAEQNSVYVQDILKNLAPKYHFSLVQADVHDRTQAASTTEVLIQRADIIYSANDNTVNAAVASVVGVTRNRRMPFILGDLSTLRAGALAAVGLAYHKMGSELGAMAVAVLEGQSLTDLPPREAPAPEIWINEETRGLLDIKLPAEASDMVNQTIRGD